MTHSPFLFRTDASHVFLLPELLGLKKLFVLLLALFCSIGAWAQSSFTQGSSSFSPTVSETLPSEAPTVPSKEELKELRYWLRNVEERAHQYLAVQKLCHLQFSYWLPLPTCLSIKNSALPLRTIEPVAFLPEENGALRFAVSPSQCFFLRNEALTMDAKIRDFFDKNPRWTAPAPAVPINSHQELLFSAYGTPTFSLSQTPLFGCQIDFQTQLLYGYFLQPTP